MKGIEGSSEDRLRTGDVASFGPFRFDHGTLELRRDGEVLPLEPLPARILGRLLDDAGRLVSRDDLRRFGWPRLPSVADDSLNTCIRQIRDVLGDDARDPRWIETLRGRGYRFVGGAVSSRGEPRVLGRAVSSGGEPHVLGDAVSAGGEPRVGGGPGAVPSPSAGPPRGRATPGRLAVLVATAAAVSAVALWPRASIDPGPDAAAREAEAIRYRMERALDAPGALVLADRAVASWPGDPELAALRAGLLVQVGRLAAADAEAQRALALRPDHPDALRARGNLRMLEGRWAEAARDLETAVRRGDSDPANWISWAFLRTVTGDFEEASRGIARALALDPLSPHVLGDVGLLHLWAGRFVEALESCGRAVEVEPRAGWAVECAFDAARLAGDHAAALAWGRRLVQPDEEPAGLTLGTLLAARVARLERLGEGGADRWTLAVAYASAGRADDAARLLAEAASTPHFGVLGAAVDPRFGDLREEPAFQRTLATLGLHEVRRGGGTEAP